MNANLLLEALTSGATLQQRWKLRYSVVQKPKKLLILTYPDGEKEHVQYSCLKPLLESRKVFSIPIVGGGYEYRLNNNG